MDYFCLQKTALVFPRLSGLHSRNDLRAVLADYADLLETIPILSPLPTSLGWVRSGSFLGLDSSFSIECWATISNVCIEVGIDSDCLCARLGIAIREVGLQVAAFHQQAAYSTSQTLLFSIRGYYSRLENLLGVGE